MQIQWQELSQHFAEQKSDGRGRQILNRDSVYRPEHQYNVDGAEDD